jgi:hypothetical protein
MLANTSVIDLEFREDFENYLREFPGAPVRSLQDLLDQGLLHNVIEGTMRRKLASKGRESEDYRTAMAKRAALQQTVLKVMRDEKLDAFVYPTMRRRAAIIGEAQDGSTCQLSASTGFPAISVPAGFTATGLPVGVELLGAPLQDARLVAFAYAFEQSTPHRQPPPLTPALTSGGAAPRLTWDTFAAGSEVIPPVSSTLRIPVHLVFEVATNELRYSLNVAAGNESDILYVTLHRAASGKNGPVAMTLVHGPFSPTGSLILSEADRKNLIAGELYISIATKKFPRGELRAQLRPTR